MPKSLIFAINHDNSHKFRLKFARATECKYACEDVFACVYGWTCVYKDRELNLQNSNFSKSSGWCSVLKLRLTGVSNSFHDFLIGLLEGHFYYDYFVPVTFYLFCFYTLYIDIRILIDSATVTITILLILPLRGLPAVFLITISSDRFFL